MNIQFWAATDIGRVRDHNEDNFLVDKRLNLFVVCDGMGGHAAGEVASAVCVRMVRDVIANNRKLIEHSTANPGDLKARKKILKLLEYAIQEACTRVFDLAQSDQERRGMGTTCSLMMLVGLRCFIAHVGDSRIYLARRAQVHQLTEDHSLVNEMIRQGKLSEEEAVKSPYKNAITRAVGVYESVEVDTLTFELSSGDRLLLCSDGLSMYTDLETLGQYLKSGYGAVASQSEMKHISEALLRYANSCGGKDNVTAVVVAIDDEKELKTEDVHLTMETIRQIPLFQFLSYKELVRIINVTQKRTVSAGEVVVREGEAGNELYIILRGDFVVESAKSQLAVLGSGRHFGEMALIDEQVRSATVSSKGSGQLLVITRPNFYDLLRKDANLAVKLLWNFVQTLSSRLRDGQQFDGSVRRRHHQRPPTSTSSHPLSINTSKTPPIGLHEADLLLANPSLDSARSAIADHIKSVQEDIGEDITLPGLSAEELGIDGLLALPAKQGSE